MSRHFSNFLRFYGALRLVASVLLVTLVGTMPVTIAASYAELCCEDDEEDVGGLEGEQRDCDCPLGCSACCVSVARGVVAHSAPTVITPILGLVLRGRTLFVRPPRGIARDILHVPKLAA